MTDAADGEKQKLTLLSDEFNQGDKSDIRRGTHGMVQQDPAESAVILVAESDRASRA